MFLEEVRALKLLKATHIKIEWVSCRVRRKMEVNRCYRSLGFGHMAANCRGPDRSRSCWRYGEEGHTAGSCTRQSQCYLCYAKEDEPRDDHIPGTIRCAAFREAAPKRKPLRGRIWSLCSSGVMDWWESRGVLSLVCISSAESHTTSYSGTVKDVFRV